MAYADLYDVTKVKIGNALGYLAAHNATPTPALPANTVVLWDDRALTVSSWTKMGATEESFQLNSEVSLEQHYVEEQATPVATSKTSQAFSITASLAQDTMQNMAWAWDGTITTSVNSDSLVLNTDVKVWAFGLEMQNELGFARRLFIPRATMTSGGATAFRRAASKRLYPITITAICKPEEILIRNTKVVA
jgi:hypothetical protein